MPTLLKPTSSALDLIQSVSSLLFTAQSVYKYGIDTLYEEYRNVNTKTKPSDNSEGSSLGRGDPASAGRHWRQGATRYFGSLQSKSSKNLLIPRFLILHSSFMASTLEPHSKYVTNSHDETFLSIGFTRYCGHGFAYPVHAYDLRNIYSKTH